MRIRMKELISVIVPVHNGQDYLEKCIDSIAAQTYDSLEIIVVNDGSTDNTAQICENLQKKYADMYIITLPDIGVAAARNRALDQAKGAYVTFVDADDRLCPDMLERLYHNLKGTDSDVAGCRFTAWSTEDEWKRIVDGEPEAEGAEATGISDEILNMRAGKQFDSYHYLTDNILQDNCRCWSKLYRRSAIENVRFREELTIGEDMLFLVDLLPHISNAVELEYAGYGYYQNPKGLMRRPFKPSYMDQIKCWELAKEEILRVDTSLESRVNARLMTAIMLTVGKIALLSGKGRREVRDYLMICREKLSLYSSRREDYTYLPAGYGIKIRLFTKMPGLYMMLYHGLQMMKR